MDFFSGWTSLLVSRPFVLLVAFLGNVAFWVYWFNRVNATGFLRNQIKILEKLCVVACFLIPAGVYYFDRQNGFDVFRPGGPLSIPDQLFLVFCFGSLIGIGPGWIRDRVSLYKVHPFITERAVQRIDMHKTPQVPIYAKDWVACWGRLPLNELRYIERTTETVHLSRLAKPLDGFTIAQISDIHLTGYMTREYYREAIQLLVDANVDLVIMCGDLIDYEHCLHQVQPLLEPLRGKLGQYFVLGNHDRRLANVGRLRSMLEEIGWFDLGMRSHTIETRAEEIYLIGNERPWFDPPCRNADENATAEARKTAGLRIGVAHTPDQIQWARKLGLDLLFCGHNHGGQVRLPLIGPVITPSWYGSRYASGWFDETPTLLHVSRGVSGTHPLRFQCTPEVNVVKLEASSSRL